MFCYAFDNVKFNGVLKFAGTVKNRGFDNFSRCKSRECGNRVSYCSTLKLSDRRRFLPDLHMLRKGYHVSR